MRPTLNITKALADPTRLRILMALRAGELCLCQIVELLQLAPSTLSKHLHLLYQAELVERRKDGRWHYFRLAEPVDGSGANGAARAALQWLEHALADDPTIADDARRLERVRSRDLMELTGCYRN